MGTVKQIDIKNKIYCFHNDMIDINKFDSYLLKIYKKSYKDIGIYNIGYIAIKKIDDYENIYIYCKSFVFDYYTCKWIY